jgi:hypothetical protein
MMVVEVVVVVVEDDPSFADEDETLAAVDAGVPAGVVVDEDPNRDAFKDVKDVLDDEETPCLTTRRAVVVVVADVVDVDVA